MGAGTSVELLERIETHISIRSPHAGRDSPGNDGDGNHRSFQSTRPMRGETAQLQAQYGLPAQFQSTRPMRGETADGLWWRARASRFQSTRPMRGETRRTATEDKFARISIHSPYAGRDRNWRCWQRPNSYFNPLAPCGARLRRHTSCAYAC